MNKIFEKVLLDKENIEDICKKLGKEIENDYKDTKDVIFLGLLKGCHPFMSDLIRFIEIKAQLAYMDVSSYEGTKSTQDLIINMDLQMDIKNKNIIIIEDVVDTGNTLNRVINLLKKRGANSIEIVTLIDKPENRTVKLEAKYVGKKLGKEFIIGYGLDYNEYYRNLDCIGIPTKEIIEEK